MQEYRANITFRSISREYVESILFFMESGFILLILPSYGTLYIIWHSTEFQSLYADYFMDLAEADVHPILQTSQW